MKYMAAAVPLAAWPLLRLLGGEVRWEFVLLALAAPILAIWARRLFVGLYPLGLVAVLYDAMRYLPPWGITADRVHVCDLRAVEMRFFGITLAGRPATVHDWLQLHASPPLDLLFAIPYATFLLACAGFGVFLWRRDFLAMRRFAWTFFALNVLGFVTYHLYPAAPPWYFHAHGCTVDLGVPASEGPNLARVDAWLGLGYFEGMYRRASDVFGAVPSLHVAYPLIILLVGWGALGLVGRSLAVLFLLTMCGAAVYLDHHWIVDVIMGLGYASLAAGIVAAAVR